MSAPTKIVSASVLVILAVVTAIKVSQNPAADRVPSMREPQISQSSSRPGVRTRLHRESLPPGVRGANNSVELEGFEIPASFLKVASVIAMDAATCQLTEEFYQFVGVEERHRAEFKEAFERYLDEFTGIEAANAELVSDVRGSYFVLSPCNEFVAATRERFLQTVGGEMDQDKATTAMILIENSLRGGGAEKAEVYLEYDEELKNGSIHVTYFDDAGAAARTIAFPTDAQSFSSTPRWAKLDMLSK